MESTKTRALFDAESDAGDNLVGISEIPVGLLALR